MKDLKYYQDKCERLEKVITMRECQLRCACDGLEAIHQDSLASVNPAAQIGLIHATTYKTLEAVEAIYEEWDQESQAANDCIVEILESYLQFVNVTERTIKCFAELPEKYETMFDMLVKKVRNKWTPILETAVKKQNKKAQKSAKKSA